MNGTKEGRVFWIEVEGRHTEFVSRKVRLSIDLGWFIDNIHLYFSTVLIS